MSYQTIQFEMHGSICLLTLNRPDRLNALTVEVASDFNEAVREALEKGARVIVLTGAGRAFCAGGDLREMQEIASREGRVEAFFDEPLRILNESILLIRRTPVPFIAAVNGVASGGGCNLALACDVVIAAESAKFNQAFIKIGLVPDCGGTFMLPRLVGSKRAAELMPVRKRLRDLGGFRIAKPKIIRFSLIIPIPLAHPFKSPQTVAHHHQPLAEVGPLHRPAARPEQSRRGRRPQAHRGHLACPARPLE